MADDDGSFISIWKICYTSGLIIVCTASKIKIKYKRVKNQLL